MAHPGWYVIHVQTGCEQQTCDLLEALCRQEDLLAGRDGQLLEECFFPRFRTQRKRRREWRDVEHPLMPGYVIAVTAEPGRLARVLRGTSRYARILSMGGAYVPLSEEERRWLDEQTRPGERVVPMSVAYKRGDGFVVVEGPLMGRERMLVRVDRSNSMAHLELHAGQMTMHTTVGLAVLPERKAWPLPEADAHAVA